MAVMLFAHRTWLLAKSSFNEKVQAKMRGWGGDASHQQSTWTTTSQNIVALITKVVLPANSSQLSSSDKQVTNELNKTEKGKQVSEWKIVSFI